MERRRARLACRRIDSPWALRWLEHDRHSEVVWACCDQFAGRGLAVEEDLLEFLGNTQDGVFIADPDQRNIL